MQRQRSSIIVVLFVLCCCLSIDLPSALELHPCPALFPLSEHLRSLRRFSLSAASAPDRPPHPTTIRHSNSDVAVNPLLHPRSLTSMLFRRCFFNDAISTMQNNRCRAMRADKLKPVRDGMCASCSVEVRASWYWE